MSIVDGKGWQYPKQQKKEMITSLCIFAEQHFLLTTKVASLTFTTSRKCFRKKFQLWKIINRIQKSSAIVVFTPFYFPVQANSLISVLFFCEYDPLLPLHLSSTNVIAAITCPYPRPLAISQRHLGLEKVKKPLLLIF